MQPPRRAAAPVAPSRALETHADAARLVNDLAEVMEALLAIVEQETELVRAGRIDQAAQLEPRKAELASRYMGAAERLKQNAKFLSAALPGEIDALRQRHDMFRSLLQINLTVLATAHAVSESIIRGVAGELTRKATPQTYGLSGRPTAAAPNAVKPVTLSRSL
jgi:hypothetical protein